MLLSETFYFLKKEKLRKTFLRSLENSLGVCLLCLRHVRKPKHGARSSQGVCPLFESQVTEPHWGVLSDHGLALQPGRWFAVPLGK